MYGQYHEDLSEFAKTHARRLKQLKKKDDNFLVQKTLKKQKEWTIKLISKYCFN